MVTVVPLLTLLCTLIEKQLRAEVDDLSRQAEEADHNATPDALDIPAEQARREERLSAIAAAKVEFENRAAGRYAEEQVDYEKKLAERKSKEQEAPWQAAKTARARPSGQRSGQLHG